MGVLQKMFSDKKYGFDFMQLYFHLVPGHLLIWFLLNSIQKEILKVWLQKSTIQKEMELVTSKLQEAVITKDFDNKISFTNDKGHKIVRMITKFHYDLLNEDQTLKDGIDDENDDESLPTEEMMEKVTEQVVLESKVFQAFGEFEKTLDLDKVQVTKKLYSMEDFFSSQDESIEKMVFLLKVSPHDQFQDGIDSSRFR